jgi:hypothetical protein
MATINYHNSNGDQYKLMYESYDTFYKSELEKTIQLKTEEISLLEHYFNDTYFDNLNYKSIFKREFTKKLTEYYAENIKKLENLIYKNNLGLIKVKELIEKSKTTLYTTKKFMKKIKIILKEYNIPAPKSYYAEEYIVKSFFFDIMKSWPIDIRTDIFKNIATKLTEKIKYELNIIDIDRKKIIFPTLYNLFGKNHYVLQSFNNHTFYNILTFILQFTYIINCELTDLEIKSRYFEFGFDYDIFDINMYSILIYYNILNIL